MTKKKLTEDETKYRALYRAIKRARKLLDWEDFKTMEIKEDKGLYHLIAYTENDMRFISIDVTGKRKDAGVERKLTRLNKIKLPENAKGQLWVWQKDNGYHVYDVLRVEPDVAKC